MASVSEIDLHTHSRASDGVLDAAELVARAAARGVRVLALTDHDTTAAVADAAAAAREHGIDLVPGVEISTSWMGHSLHVVGLFIDPDCGILRTGLSDIRGLRGVRAETMARRLARVGLSDPLGTARAAAAGGVPTRTHFARAMVAQDFGADVAAIFRKYLRPGKPGYVRTEWPALEAAVGWIRAAGGRAVLAHPFAYRLSGAWMRRLLSAFVAAGGTGIEVVCGGGGPSAVESATHYAKRFDLAGSVGSDFHDPARRWNDLGRLRPLPDGIEPVWQGRIAV